MRISLTAALVKTATAEPGKDRTLFWDAALPGFGLCVTQGGARSFVVQYRADGRSRQLTFDAGTLSLNEARKEARKRMGEVAKGGDPVIERRKQAAAAETATAGTLEAVLSDYLKREGRKIRTANERRAVFNRLILPKLGKLQVDAIQRSDLVRLLDRIEDERGPVMATKALAFMSALFGWYAARTDGFRSPIVRGMARSKPRERARDRVLSDDEIRALWQATEKKPEPFSSLVRFLLLTATRRNEAAQMTRAEITGSEWLIPAARHKSKAECLLPLSKAALAVLAAVPVIGKKASYIFTTDGEHAISGFSKAKSEIDKASCVTGWRLHDLRRTARSSTV